MAQTIQPNETNGQPIDDYGVGRETGGPARPATHHVLTVLNALLLIILAAISFSLFWVVATLLGFV